MKHLPYLLTSALFPFLLLLGQAKYEPTTGCYIGAFIQNDPLLQALPYGDAAKFESLTRKHSTYLTYAGYGYAFPSQLAQYYKAQNTILQIGFEPNNGLDEVKDSTYLRSWARAARESGTMIFLRWASEMNGNWVAWYGNPAKYIEKWRIVWRVMREEAPNVAMVWTPNDVPNSPGSPTDNPLLYYPGDAYVDWVGIDFYCVYFYENGSPERTDPRQKLKTIYDVYASRKPIMVSEWGVAHNTTRGDTSGIGRYALGCLDSLYGHLQAEFPRVKSVTYFDYNSSTVDWKLTNDASILAAYKKSVSAPYCLEAPSSNIPFITISGISDNDVITATKSATAAVSSAIPLDSLSFSVDSLTVATLTSAPYQYTLDAGILPQGKHQLKATAYAHSGYSNFASVWIVVDRNGEYTNLIIDNGEDGFTTSGAWTNSSSQPDRYGNDYLYSQPGNGSITATWQPKLPRAGYYNVYAWWSVASNRATNAPYSVHHAHGTTTVRVNQQTNGGQWNLLGSYPFVQGNSGSLVLSNDANNLVIADAARFEWAFEAMTVPREIAGPKDFALLQNYPNPFNPTTVIRYHIASASLVTLRISDILGRELFSVVHEFQPGGDYAVTVNASSLASGIYFYRLTAGNFNSTKTMLLLK